MKKPPLKAKIFPAQISIKGLEKQRALTSGLHLCFRNTVDLE
jgi:hypothetical protein